MLYRFTTAAVDEGFRLDKFLQNRLPDFSRTTIRKIIDLGGVHLSGRRTRKAGSLLQQGQLVELHRDRQPLDIYRISGQDVVFQDDYIIVLNKSAGIDTQPTPARYMGTLYEALQVWLQRDRKFGRKLEIGMAQRLDRDTSGIILFSIHPRSHKGISDQIFKRTARKQYLAMVSGTPRATRGTFRSYLARERKSNRMKSVPGGGKEAITHYRVIAATGECSLVSVELETGRTHQIRVHFAEAGHPLIGDSLYGGKTNCEGMKFPSQCLHSWMLEIEHPVHNRTMTFTAPPPETIQQLFPQAGDER
jgi:23S rRNA pseudouridine1911/1915/1917 synthase